MTTKKGEDLRRKFGKSFARRSSAACRDGSAAQAGGGGGEKNKDGALIVAIASLKGGCGKTTSAVSIAWAMRQKGKRVLLIDLDPQGDATLWTGGVKDRRFSDWICDGGRTDLRERISGDLLPSSAAMAEVPERIGSRKDRVSILSRGMRQVSAGYDFIIIDCPPGDSLILANALFAADAYLVPVTPRHYSGLVALRNLAEDWAEAVPRPVASFAGAILCMAKEKTKATAETLERLRRQLGRKFVEPPVPFAVGVQDAWGERMVPGKKHGEKAAEAYQRIAEKIIRRGREWVS